MLSHNLPTLDYAQEAYTYKTTIKHTNLCLPAAPVYFPLPPKAPATALDAAPQTPQT
jgi:hypothetical protein